MMAATIVAMLTTATAIAAPPVTAVNLALRCVCSSYPDRKACMENRSKDVPKKVHDLLEITREYGDQVPESMRLILLAVACGESGFRNSPTCGGDPGCNDAGTTGGMFQIKLSRERGSLRWTYEQQHPDRPPLDAFDHLQAGRFYLERLIWGVSRRGPVKRNCGWRGHSKNEIWNIAAYRLGRGPVLYWEAPVPGKRRRAVQRCAANSRYARTALNWWRRCRDCWKAKPPTPATSRLEQSRPRWRAGPSSRGRSTIAL